MKGIITGKVLYDPKTWGILDEIGDTVCEIPTITNRQHRETLARFIVDAINEKIERENQKAKE